MVALETQEEADSGDGPQLALLQRYFPAQCWLQPDASGPGEHRLRVCLEPGGLGPRAEWSVIFQADGEMTTQPTNPSFNKTLNAGGQP
jgi:hypothetical protein